MSEFVTYVIQRHENVDATDAANAARRARIVDYTQEFVLLLWMFRDWPWRRSNSPAAVTVTSANSYGLLPADFESIGRRGSVYVTSSGQPVDFMDEERLRMRRAKPGNVLSVPQYYSIFGQDAASFVPLLQTDALSANIGLSVTYNRAAPTLVDGGANDSRLKQVPERYHLTVLAPAIRARLDADKGQISKADYEARLQAALALMVRTEQPGQAAVSQLPSFFGAR